MFEKFSRLDVLEMIIGFIALISFFNFLIYHGTSYNAGIIFATCLVLIVWIEIHKDRTKKSDN